MLVFVYGTLMSGLSNHGYLSKAQFLGRAKTKEKYSLFCRGIPYVDKRSNLYHIEGEIYEITDGILKTLDILEGHPNFYCREEIQVITEEGEEKTCFIYFCRPSGSAELRKNGNYREYVEEVRYSPVKAPIT